ncbi:MAG: hypothetical protein FJ296_01680 [Planctomycetes bacterium]|nr:hypothetical protein [Planctomycetota bacterium]
MSADAVRRARAAWPIALPALLLLGLLLVALRARQQLQRAPEFVVDPSRVQLVGRPAWMPEPVAAGVAGGIAARVAGSASLLHEDELKWLSAAVLASSPWVEAVEQVEPRWPGQAEIRVRLRRPVLAVEGDILLAADGRVLGLGPVMLSPTPLQLQGPLSDAAVLDCAAAAGEVLPFRPALEEAGVRLVAVRPDLNDTLTFVTDAGVELCWGRARRASRLAYLDIDPAQRIEHLRQVLIDFPGLQTVRRVELWLDRPQVSAR